MNERDTLAPALPSLPRRNFLELAAGAAAGAALPAASSIAADAANAPIATRPIPRTGERLPVVGLGTAIISTSAMTRPSAPSAPRSSEPCFRAVPG